MVAGQHPGEVYDMDSSRQIVVSGVPHRVTSVGREDPPPGLEGFLGDTEFTIDMAGSPYVVSGCGGWHDTQMRFHEKEGGQGHDIRVWHVTRAEQGFLAEHVAAF